MKEADPKPTNKRRSMDEYFADPKTRLARTLRKLSGEPGEIYRNSLRKRVFDRVLASHAVEMTRPATVALTAVIYVDGQSPYYEQPRVGTQPLRRIYVKKLRTMEVGSDAPRVFGERGRRAANGEMHTDATDPRVTRIGRVIRPLELDELLQLDQAKKGELALIENRAIAFPDVISLNAQLGKEKFDEWANAYEEGNPGIFNLHAALSSRRKGRLKDKYRYDTYYAKHADFGLDLYILYRTAKRLEKGIQRRIRKYIRPEQSK